MRGIRHVIISILVWGSAAAAVCSPGGVKIGVLNRHGSETATVARVTGKLVASACREVQRAGEYAHSLTIPPTCSGTCTCGVGSTCFCEAGVPRCEISVKNIAPGEWLHRVEVPATGQKQHRRALVMGDSSAPASVAWTAYRSVLTVTSDLDDGRPGTLRSALNGSRAEPPVLVQFDHARHPAGMMTIRLTDSSQLRIATETVVDGTNADGDPSPLSAFAERTYKTIIELDPADKSLANASTLRFNSAGSGLRGVYLRRILGADALVARRDQDLVAFGVGARRGFVETSKLDGGSAHRLMQDCPGNTSSRASNPAQGKDCIDVEAIGSLAAADAVVVSQSELRHCYDRALKSQDAATIVRDCWVHHSGRGGLFAQSRNGRIEAMGNLIEENGKNCPAATRCRGGPRDGLRCCPWGLDGAACRAAPALPNACPGSVDPGCGSGTCVPIDDGGDRSGNACDVSGTRGATAQLSAEGGGAQLRTQGNTVRNGMRSGIFFRDDTSGSLRDDFICGMQFGIEAAAGAGRAAQIDVGGVASVLNSGAGVLLSRNAGAVAMISFGDFAAIPRVGTRNAFSNNGAPGARRAANFNAGSTDSVRKAEGNQWQNGGAGSTCRSADVAANDVAPSNARLDVEPCEAVRNPSGGTAVLDVSPRAARRGDVVHVVGTGFNAIEGYGSNDGAGGATTCAGLAAGNTCGPIPRGTCVEFEQPDGEWIAASSVLAVTPTRLVVRSPIDCSAPTRIRVRRKSLGGGSETFTSATPVFCRNE